MSTIETSSKTESDHYGESYKRRFASVVDGHAHAATSQSDFLERMAGEVVDAFSMETLFLSHPDWASPRRLRQSTESPSEFDPSFVAELLQTSTCSPVATNLARCDADDDSRVLHVRLMDDPKGKTNSAMILVYPNRSRPSAVEQVRDLKRLGDVADQLRTAMGVFDGAEFADANRGISVEQRSGQTSLRYLNEDLDLAATTYRISNELRRQLHCDRVTVLTRRRKRFRVASVSGVAVPDRRANSIKAAERFARASAVLGRPV
ncbi:MAG: hypothetical protein AAGJ83_15595, partial [Planctomycetota bacterium]